MKFTCIAVMPTTHMEKERRIIVSIANINFSDMVPFHYTKLEASMDLIIFENIDRNF